jgi:nucleoside-diphosphate-sugar epimerase
MVRLLERMLGRPLRRAHRPPRAGDVPHTLADIGSAKRDFGYEPVVDFEEGLRRTVEFFRGRTS